jgi:hypothetical protein
MRLLDKMDRKFRRYAVPNLTLYLILGQVLFFIFAVSGRFVLERVILIPERVIMGEWWRLITFLFIPPLTNPIFAFFAWYLFYLMGNALEGQWGALRYNLFILIGYLVTVGAAFLFPNSAATNVFIGGSVFLAFAYLFPDFQLYIFFILPVKIKWLALLTWIGYAYQLLVSPSWSNKFMVLASLANFLIFFGQDILLRIRSGKRQMTSQVREVAARKEPFHKCETCGVTDLSHPQMEFRYCPECGGLGYCTEHIFKHEHVRKK